MDRDQVIAELQKFAAKPYVTPTRHPVAPVVPNPDSIERLQAWPFATEPSHTAFQQTVAAALLLLLRAPLPVSDKCRRCGYIRAEHHYNGACYGVCGQFQE